MSDVLGPSATEPAHTTFVGRAAELELFGKAVDRMLAGRQEIVTLLGEPGIGKTRCAEVFARAAEDQGALVLWGRCFEEPGAPPYWPWVQIVREYIEASSPSEARLAMGSALPHIAAIIPELANETDAPQLPAAESVGTMPQARFRAFDAIGRMFGKAARHVPLMLVIDNVHWADAPSLSLLEFLCQALSRCRVLMLCTYRDAEVSRRSPLLATLGELGRQTRMERMRLSGISADAIAELASRMTGAPLPQSAVEALYERTDGNPLFVIELLRMLMEESAGNGNPSVATRVPDGVRETLGRRLSRLPERCNDLLAVASVFGRHFTAQELAAARNEPFDAVLTELAAADRAGLVEANGAPGAYRFTHALIRETLYEEIPTPNRLRLHACVGDALAAIHGTRATTAVSRIAYHYFEAAPLGKGDRAAELAMQAAENATRVLAYEEAILHCDHAVGALSLVGPENDERMAGAYLLKGWALTRVGQVQQAMEALLCAVKHALPLQDGELLVDVASRLALTSSFGPQQHTVRLLEKGLALLPAGPSIGRAKALASLAFALRSAGDRARIPPMVAEAIDVADRLGDPFVVCFCLQFCVMALRGDPDALPRRLALGRRLIGAARASGSEDLLADAYCWHELDLLDSGDADGLEALLHRCRLLRMAGLGVHQYYVGTWSISLALLRGEWSGLEERIERLLEVGAKTRRQDAEGAYGAQMFVLNRDLGRLQALRPVVKGLADAGSMQTWLPGTMLLCAELGLAAEAGMLLERFAADGFRGVARDDMYVVCLVFCAETCYRLGDRVRARRLHELLLPYGDQTASYPRAAFLGAVSLYLGMLCAAFGDESEACERFEQALVKHRQMRAWPWLARTQRHYGELLMLQPGSEAKGRALLSDAEQLASRLEMSGLAQEIAELLRGTEQRTDWPAGLTAREIEVLRLLAIGRSNRDISAVLSISLNTVATHIRSIFGKTHCANRTEAAAYAINHELTERTSADK